MANTQRKPPLNDADERKLLDSVKRNKARYRAITPEFAEFPYSGDVAITYDMWLNAMTATEYVKDSEATIKQLDEMTGNGFSRLVSIFGDDYTAGRTISDFWRVIEALEAGSKSDAGEPIPLDRFGYPNIADYMAGCRESVSVSVEEIDSIDLDTFVAPWHGRGPTSFDPFGGAPRNNLYTGDDGTEWAILPYNLLWSWDMFKVLTNLYSLGFGGTVRRILGGKLEAQQAAQLEEKAAIINYGNMTGVMIGYSLACNEIDKMFAAEIVKDNPAYKLNYKPDAGVWGPTIELTLPRTEIRAWRAAGGNPQQLKRLRGVIYSTLCNESNPYWWRRYQITLTFGQIERSYWNETDHKVTEDERTLLEKSLSLLVNTRLVCTYPDLDKKQRHSHIDVKKLTIEGLALLPAVFVHGVDANGHVVEDSSLKFYAMPPLDEQADELNQAYTAPYLNGTPRVKRIAGRIETTTYDVQTTLVKYIRIAKAEGSQTVYIDSLTCEVEPFKVAEITETIENDEIVISMGGTKDQTPDEAKQDIRRQQQRMRDLRRRVKRDVLRVLPNLIENEATAEKPHYLNVDTAPGRRDGFTITRVKPTDRQRKEHRSPRTHFTYGKKVQKKARKES